MFENLTVLMPYIQKLIAAAPALTRIIQEAKSNDDILSKLQTMAPDLAPLLTSIGKELFPAAVGPIQAVGGAIAAYGTELTKWLQTACNQLLTPSPHLVVDGNYGPRTRAAVEQLQKQLGLTVDGLAGKLTQAAIARALRR